MHQNLNFTFPFCWPPIICCVLGIELQAWPKISLKKNKKPQPGQMHYCCQHDHYLPSGKGQQIISALFKASLMDSVKCSNYQRLSVEVLASILKLFFAHFTLFTQSSSSLIYLSKRRHFFSSPFLFISFSNHVIWSVYKASGLSLFLV